MDKYAYMQNFVFKGLLLNETLGDLTDAGIYLPEEAIRTVSHEEDISLEDFSITIRINALKMSSIYIAFYCFENAVRELVSSRLKERHGSDWWDKCVSAGIKKKVEGRKKKEFANRWHDPRGSEPISYADFGDLSDIIITKWVDFEDFFPEQDWIRNRLNDLEESRNVIAHNNLLSERDIMRIKSHLGDWLRQVG